MPLDLAWEKAWRELRQASPFVISAKSSALFEAGKFVLPFFHRTFFIHYPEIRIEEPGKPEPPSRWLQLIMLHYLLTADGTPLTDYWITYRYLPGALLFEARFHSLALQTLVQAFGGDAEGFQRSALALGGVPLTRTGDAAFKFSAFPYLPLTCILHLGDEEVPPSMNMLFDASAPHYLPTEDLSYLGTYLSTELQKHKNA